MCGIAGFFGEDQAKIERMADALRHRGPDGNFVLLTHGASLAHARLAILDPSPSADQPMWNDARTAVMIYNGEITNFKQLREDFRLDCRTNSDTEVMLKLYDRYGITFVKYLKGMFAFGLYDVSARTWHLVRDTSGIKPLFVAYPQGKLHFASEMRCLMGVLPQKPALSLCSLSQYMRLQYVPGPQTLCEGIESLSTGTILSWSERGETRTTFRALTEELEYYTEEEFREVFPSLMDEVVRDTLVSDKPVGIFLSGGMDSTIVLHHMVRHASPPVKTFTVRFEATKEEDERRFNADANAARLTAKHYGTDHREVVLTAELCRQVYRDTARALDQPNADSVAMAQFVLSKEAKREVDVVLCGAGGDELFGGYPRYRIAKILKTLGGIPAPLRGLAGSLFGYPSDVLKLRPGPALAERLLARPAQELNPIIRGSWFDPTVTTKLFMERFEKLNTLTPAAGGHDPRLRERGPLRQFMEFDRGFWLVDESLRLNDAVTMAHGLECRPPFLDPRIISASHGTREDWHVSLTRTKCLLKDTYYPLLPVHIQQIAKASFYPPLAKWFRRECSSLVEEALEGKRIREFFDVEKLRVIFEEHRSRRTYALHTLATIVQLHCWFETVYDAR